MPDPTLTDAALEAYASQDVTRVALETFVVYHPDATTLRYVLDVVDHTIGGYTYTACAMKVGAPANADSGTQTLEVAFDDVLGVGNAYIKLIKASPTKATLTYARYFSDNLVTPASDPFTLDITSVSLKSGKITVRAKASNFINMKAGRLRYDVTRYPGLR